MRLQLEGVFRLRLALARARIRLGLPVLGGVDHAIAPLDLDTGEVDLLHPGGAPDLVDEYLEERRVEVAGREGTLSREHSVEAHGPPGGPEVKLLSVDPV